MKKLLIMSILVMFSSIAFAQYLADDLPKTWRQQVPNGFMEFTLNEDGSLTSVTCFGCYSCQGRGMCMVCCGTGTQFFLGSIMPCGSCVGNGHCNACGGKGYNTFNSRTQYGVTVTIDENGETHISGAGSSGYGSSSSSKNYVDKIEYVPCYGYDCDKYCPKCESISPRHIHVKVRR